MDKTSRRQAIRDFKEKKVQPGVFAIRCTPSGETWVGAAQNLESQQTRYWFGLRNGGHINRAMQAAWTAHGETAVDRIGHLSFDIPMRFARNARHRLEQLRAALRGRR